MRVLRSNKDSVMAMLEAFVHDPLINWRLLNTTTDAVDAGNTPTGESSKLSGYAPQASVCLHVQAGLSHAARRKLCTLPAMGSSGMQSLLTDLRACQLLVRRIP